MADIIDSEGPAALPGRYNDSGTKMASKDKVILLDNGMSCLEFFVLGVSLPIGTYSL